MYSPAITDFILMVENTSYMFVTGPNVVKTVTHENVTSEELGGAMTHATKSGVTHFTAANGLEAIQMLKRLLSYIPQNCEEEPPSVPYEAGDESRPGLNDLIPENPNQPYDMRDVITQVIDTDSFFEVHKDFAENIVVGFARLAGRASALSRTSPRNWRAYWTYTLPRRRRVLFGSAIASIFRCSYSKTFRDSFREPTRSGTRSSPTVRNCSMRSAKRPFRALR